RILARPPGIGQTSAFPAHAGRMSALSVHPNRSTRGQPPRRRSQDHMQVSVESTGNLERRLNFSLPAEQLEAGVSGRLREIARTARIKGFRPGKVPAKVIEQRFGDQVRAEVLGALVRQTFDAAVREHELRLAGAPRIDRAAEDSLDFVATFE